MNSVGGGACPAFAKAQSESQHATYNAVRSRNPSTGEQKWVRTSERVCLPQREPHIHPSLLQNKAGGVELSQSTFSSRETPLHTPSVWGEAVVNDAPSYSSRFRLKDHVAPSGGR